MVNTLPYRRILLKLSGESLLGSRLFGIDFKACELVASYLKDIQDSGFETGVVIGGGNIFRGMHLTDDGKGISRTPADHMGMLSTLMNGIALQQALESLGCVARVVSALECPKVVETYNWRKALEYLSQGEILIFVGGTGNPYFTTDTAAALRASEIKADILLKATKVGGIYSKDPLKFPDAVKYDKISYAQVLAEKLKVMDATAIALCMHNRIPLFVFDMQRLGKESLVDILLNPLLGTLVSED